MIYIHKDGHQSGPFEERVVRDQLEAGLLSPDDKAIRHGETDWKPLSQIFPGIRAMGAPQQSISGVPPASTSAAEAQYRNTLIPKVFFGLCFLVALLGFAAAAFYFYSQMGTTGSLQTDLARISYRILGRNLTIGMFFGGFFVMIAFLLSFKRKLIQSGGLRIAMRIVFILIVLLGIINVIAGAVTYLTYSAPYRPTRGSETNELLRALEQGSDAVGPYEMAVILVPIGAGLFLLGLSGALLTKRPD